MHNDPYFRILFAALFLVGALHVLGTAFYLYWQIPIFDLPAHFLGGFWAGGMCLWLLHRYFFSGAQLNSAQIGVLGLFFGFLIGLGWEYFEVMIDAIYMTEKGYAFDTALDLVMDSSGAFLAALAYTKYGAKA